ncbi:response regulator [Qipengyuania aquimaris]|uniref:Response regulator n=1 Tax=Qipengyuania aquimaris TaxID=255984 RepID=A0A9Q3RZ50_9SPHN|nr:response regulator [Qipengyuania aquimaris]MBY6217190.1 response regulator [Qipengyuania aquimaris]
MQRIMIVDDEALVLFDMTMTVEDLGYEVFCDCISVPDALECLGDDCPDAALLDIDVGGTMVWPLARVLDQRDCPIIFVSANKAHPELENEFKHCGFIDKPASSEQIEAKLGAVVRKGETSPRVAVNRA